MTFNYKIFIMCSIFILITVTLPSKALGFNFDSNKPIPEVIIQYANNHGKQNEEYNIYYIMKWHKYKVYSIKKKTYGIVFISPKYVLYDGGQILIPVGESKKKLELDIRIHTNKVFDKNNRTLTRKLTHNANKIMEIEDYTEPPMIPPVLYKYTDKYMIKGDDVHFLYLMDWGNQHVYRTYWSRYGFVLNPLTVILYDGHKIRRPSAEEFKIMLKPMQKAYEQYLNEQAHLHSKD